MNFKNRNYSSSDDGYNSDLEIKKEKLKFIQRDNQEFQRKYKVQKILNNSANGVLYTGINKQTREEVVIKQVPIEKIRDFVQVDGRSVPKEFHVHRIAQYTNGVVKVYDWFEKKTS